MGRFGKKVGSVLRNKGQAAVSLWHTLTPFINRLGRSFCKELGPIGLEIVKNAVAVAIQRGLKGEDARAVAIEEAKNGLNAAKVEVRTRVINFALEVFFNKESKTVL